MNYIIFHSQQVYTHDKDMLSHEQMSELQKESQFDPEILGGSIKNKIVNPDLIAERAKCSFDKKEAYETIFNEETRYEIDLFHALMKKHPEIKADFDYYEMSR